jgi:hypothetical protein
MSTPTSVLPSLVKYDTATLASNLKDKKTAQKGGEKGSTAFTEEILNSILPPRCEIFYL